MPVVIQIGHMNGEPFWQKLVLAMAGPAITALLGSLIIGLAVNLLLDHKRRKDADRDIREQLVLEMSKVASAFYFDLLQFRRIMSARKSANASQPIQRRLLPLLGYRPPSKDEERVEIDDSYRSFRISADTLETRIDVYFSDDFAREKWHAVSDLLTVRYYDSIGGLTDLVLDNNSKNDAKFHSGLSKTELRNAKTVVRTYKQSLKSAIQAIMISKRHSGDPAAAKKKFSRQNDKLLMKS